MGLNSLSFMLNLESFIQSQGAVHCAHVELYWNGKGKRDNKSAARVVVLSGEAGLTGKALACTQVFWRSAGNHGFG